MTEHFDLTIIGASFAGLVCARSAAMRGLKVAVVEAKPDAGARVHTTGILVKKAADEIDLPHHLTRRVHGVRLYAPNLKAVDLFAPGYYFLTTDTSGVLCWLAQEAERAGARLFFGTRFADAARQGGMIQLQSPAITTRFLVGADGARSRVAKTFGLDQNQKFLTGLEVEYDGLKGADPAFLHCFINSELAPGYIGWAATGPKVTQVGLAAGPGQTPRSRTVSQAHRSLVFIRYRKHRRAPLWAYPVWRGTEKFLRPSGFADWGRRRAGIANDRRRHSVGIPLRPPRRTNNFRLSS